MTKQEIEEKALSTVYLEPRHWIHNDITKQMFPRFAEIAGLTKESLILDVGCGMGPAFEEFAKIVPMRNVDVITPNDAERLNAVDAGVSLTCKLISDLGFIVDFGLYNAIWARHSLEHSIQPFIDLHILRNALLPNGYMYVEVPAPDTVANHEDNPNHYSVLGDRMWQQLFAKVGLQLVCCGKIGLKLEIGDDLYFWYILKKGD